MTAGNVDLSVATWRKSSYSNGDGGNCVEVARVRAGTIGVRDSKSVGGPVLSFAGPAWESFISEVRAAPGH